MTFLSQKWPTAPPKTNFWLRHWLTQFLKWTNTGTERWLKISVWQDGKVLRLLTWGDWPAGVDQPVQGDAEKEGAGGEAETLRRAAGTDG